MTTTDDRVETITAFFHFVDQNHDGFVTVDEIRAACAVDLDGDGTVSPDEVIRCSKPWVDVYLAQQDQDGDRRVSLTELLAFNA